MDKLDNNIVKLFVENAYLRTKKGFITTAIIIFLISSQYITPFKDPLFNLLLHIIIIGIYLFVWLYYSGRIFYSPNTLKVLFAVEHSDKIRNESKQIKQVIESQMDQIGLSQKIKIFNMPSDFNFSNREKAEKFVVTKMVDLLIWGYVLEGKKDDENVSEFRLNFSYLYRMLPEGTRTFFQKEIQDNLKGKYWSILEKRSFEDIQIVSSNITEVSLFIIGLCLYVRGYLQESLDILEKLYNLLEKKNNEQFPNLDEFRLKVRNYIIDGYNLLGENVRNRNYNNQAKKCFDKVLKYNSKDSFAHLNLARLCYLVDNDINKAKYHTALVTDIYLKPFTDYNYAFFAVKARDENGVLKYYQKIRGFPSGNPVEILAFLQTDFEKEPDNILFHFAIGYINAYHGDKEIAKNELKKFIKEAEGKDVYSVLVGNAKPLLESRLRKGSTKK